MKSEEVLRPLRFYAIIHKKVGDNGMKVFKRIVITLVIVVFVAIISFVSIFIYAEFFERREVYREKILKMSMNLCFIK